MGKNIRLLAIAGAVLGSALLGNYVSNSRNNVESEIRDKLVISPYATNSSGGVLNAVNVYTSKGSEVLFSGMQGDRGNFDNASTIQSNLVDTDFYNESLNFAEAHNIENLSLEENVKKVIVGPVVRSYDGSGLMGDSTNLCAVVFRSDIDSIIVNKTIYFQDLVNSNLFYRAQDMQRKYPKSGRDFADEEREMQ